MRRSRTPNVGRPAVAFIGSLFAEGLEGRPGYSRAGAAFQRRLVSSFRENGLDVDHIFSIQPSSFFPRGPLIQRGKRHSDEEGCPVTDLPFINTGPLQVLTLGLGISWRLLAWAWRNRRRPRFVVQYNTYPTPGIVVASAARLAGCITVSIVADVHVPGGGSRPDTILHRIDFALQRLTLPRYHGLVVLTEEMARDFAPRTSHIVMDGAISDDQLLRIPPMNHTPRGEGRVLMYSGQISRMKGMKILLDAFRSVSDPLLRLRITGCGELEEEVKRSAADDPRIEYRGFVDYEEVLRLYESADILVNPHTTDLPSSRYMFPSKLIDYLATARPAISTRGPGVCEAFGDVLLATCDGNASSLAAAIRDASQRPREELAECGLRARDLVTDTRSWTLQGARIAAFLRSLTGDEASDA